MTEPARSERKTQNRVHELFHLSEPTHSERFVSLLEQVYPGWRDARAELNDLPLSATAWKK